ncbi:MAG TPA: ATP-binding protein, partial [Chitinophagaceae bacterium]|nr:ATP-binding protein [Chitinophagaceae bacterium]
MSQLLDFFRKLFDSADWPPRWHCGKWTEFHGWFYIVSDLLIWSAYFALPLIILKFISRRTDAKFVRAYFLFAAFILACGSTHLLDAVTFWYPAYRLNALVRFITGVVSWVTVFYTFRILPQAMKLKSHTELEKEVQERRKAEDRLKILNGQLNDAQDIAKIGSWIWDIQNNELLWSDHMRRMYEVEDSVTELKYEHFINKVHPDDRTFVNEHIQDAFASKEFATFRHRIVMDDGSVKVLQGRGEVITNETGEVVKMIGTGQDITEHHQAQQSLLNKTSELEVANIELQKFAYVASHDLQEPLRKILTFSSLLQKESAESLNQKARVYIDKIVHSSSRMQQLIEDILNFSSLKTREEAFQVTNLNDILDQVLLDMEVVISQTNAQIVADVLPQAEVIPGQMGQLFQNLLSNAMKFRKVDEMPTISIKSRVFEGKELLKDSKFAAYLKGLAVNHRIWERAQFFSLAVKDNGIGFDTTYSEKIFEIFQRLHTSQHHEGTGIGLAICKRIVDNHRGIIIANSSSG